MQVLEFYKSQLSTLGVPFDEDGFINNPKSGDPIQIKEKEFVLPTKPLLKANVWDEIHPFHPLSEDAMMGMSETQQFLMQAMKLAMPVHFKKLISDMLEIAYRPELQDAAGNPKGIKELACAAGAKESTFKKWTTIRKKIKDAELFNFYINRTGSIGDKDYQRVGVFSVPLLEEGEDGDAKLMGTTMSKNDKAIILAVVEHVFKDIPREIGSNDKTPYYHVYSQMLAAMTKRLNTLGKLYSKVTEYEQLDNKWVRHMSKFDELHGRIPRLPGNEGVKATTSSRREITPDDEAVDRLSISKRDDNPPWEEKGDSRPADHESRRENRDAKEPEHRPEANRGSQDGGFGLDALYGRGGREERREERRYSSRDDRRGRYDDRRDDRRDRRRDDRSRGRRDDGAFTLDTLFGTRSRR